MQRPRADASHQERVAKLRLARLWIGEIAERAVKRLDPRRRAGIDHLGQGVVPEILLEACTRGVLCHRVGEHLLFGMAAADTRRFHGARGGEIGRSETDSMDAWRSRYDVHPVVNHFRGLENGM